MGLMQLMPGTWRDMRALLGLGSDPHDPHDNILAGTAYLRLMYDRFGYPALFAAYNAGPARYAAARAGKRSLPAETRAYVAAVTSAKRKISLSPKRSSGIFIPLTNVGPTFRAPSDQSPSSKLFVPLIILARL
jgi:hypothetical protein